MYSPSRFNQINKYILESHNDSEFFTIIEFGTGSGETLKDLKKSYPKANLYGFDINPNPLNSIIVYKQNLDNFDFAKYKSVIKSADYFLYLDVLEHLIDPLNFLSNIIFDSKINSKIIISCPNFLSIRMFIAWFFGRLPLAEYGFFDRTHLRWFSPLDFYDFFRGKKYANISCDYIYSKNIYLRAFQRLYPSRLCSQFIFIAVK